MTSSVAALPLPPGGETALSAQPVVLLRGLTREARHWGAFPHELKVAWPDVEVVALDLPGNGRLHAERSPLDVAAMAEQCRDALRAQGVAPPYRLVAMSLGAMVALAWAERHPAEMCGAVLINTSLRRYSGLSQRLRPACYPVLARLALAHPVAAAGAWERAVLAITSRIRAVQPGPAAALLREWTAWRVERPVSRANALRQLVAAARYRAPLSAPTGVPLLVLASARDALVDPECSRRLARAWALPIAEHPAAGHDLPLDDGPWVAEQVTRFFAGDAALADSPHDAPGAR